jgi:integrase
MSLEIRKTSQWWYGRWMKDGLRNCTKLEVKVEGEPGSKERADSEKAAQAALEIVMAGVKEQKRPEDLVQEIHRVKFGHKIGSVPLLRLNDVWEKIPRKRQPKKPYMKWAKRTFLRFTDFMKKEFPRIKELAGVDRKIAEAFMRDEEKRDISPKTFNAELILLRGAFEHLREDAGMLTNPFAKMVTKDRETIHRKPFSGEELQAIMEVVKDDDLMRPLVMVGVFTAMRRGDACLLKWESVDLKNKYIRVKTSKTGETIDIPMFPLLREELAKQPEAQSGYVFPELAGLYQKRPDVINRRLGEIFAKAGFIDVTEFEAMKKENPNLELIHRGAVHEKRDKGLHTANVRGFHSFRVTWITMALAAGVPMELVRRVTGHKAAEVVLKNYFKPGREDFRKVLEGAMPTLMLGAPEKPASPAPGELLEKVLKGLETLPGPKGKAWKTWKQEQEQLVALVRQVKGLIEMPAK